MSTVNSVVDDDEPEVGENEINNNDEDFDFDTTSEDTPAKNNIINAIFKRNFTSDPDLTAAADRWKLTPMQQLGYTAALLKCAGVRSDQVNLSRTTIRRSRTAWRETLARELDENYILEVKDKVLTIHWDEKLMKSLVDTEQLERLAILLSSEGKYREGRLLTVATLPKEEGTGKDIALHIMRALEEQGLAQIKLGALVFDTTSKNSGCVKGAAKVLEALVGHKMLYLACMKHVMEIFLGAAWEALFGKTTSSENTDCNSFKKKWGDIDKTAGINVLPEFEGGFKDMKESTISLLKKLLATLKDMSVFPRTDYREACELALMMLGSPPDRWGCEDHWASCGATHHARWMHLLLYGPKMLAFGSQIGSPPEFLRKLEVFVSYTSLIHIRYWMRAGWGRDLPVLTLSLFRDIVAFSSIDPELSKVLESKLNGKHTWYITEEVIIFCLCSKLLSLQEKELMAQKLLSFPIPRLEDMSLGKPKLPTVDKDTQLVDLVGPNSWLVF